MARCRLLQPYNLHPAGSVIDLPGGIANVLATRKILEIAPPEPLRSFDDMIELEAKKAKTIKARKAPETRNVQKIDVPPTVMDTGEGKDNGK